MANIGKQPLAIWRRIANMSQEEFAEALDVDRVTVSLWETGYHLPNATNRRRIEQVLNIDYFEDVLVPKQ